MPKKLLPIEVLQRYLDDLNIYQDSLYFYYVSIERGYFYLRRRHIVSLEIIEDILYRSTDFEKFFNRVSFIARRQVREYMRDITYPYKRKVGHAARS